ncbi:uncharacterized protein LOC131428697 [Malaya genurostris]|uniref:uncharacterized protein LOC131428697 n=1 Tax=Malaya genurostris TaxID=325434 RepID=UPI0026F396F8|nr:uncharacterized protein LOC131428697 [Malaya genurostris]
MDVATFGAVCSPASAPFIKNLNASQHSDRFPSAAKAIIHRHYVDDYLDSTDTVTEAIERAKQVRYVHSQAGFTIRNWISNSAIFDQALDDVKKEEGIPLYDRKDKATERVLGIIWRPKEDAFTFSLSFHSDSQPYIAEGKRPTKRIALRCVMSLFDPLGLLAPFTVHGKMLLQKLWRTGCNWDQEMDDECFANWSRWMKVLPIVERLRIPRCYLRGASHEAYHTLQLHVFVDASEEAYGATAYFRIATSEGPRCSLVMVKTKVAPLKQLSIPRMELQGAVLGVRLLNIVEANHELKILKRVLWTDSMNVLSWIRSDQRKYKPFVAFRIGEILQETKIDEWRWLPSRANIADILTKWGKGISLDSDGTWFNGAQLLQTPEDRWPMQNLPLPNTREELRVCHMFHTEVVEEPLIDASRISRWLVLLRTVCCVYRFISNCRRKSRGLTIEVLPDISEIMLRLVLRPQLSVTVPLKQHEYHLAEIVLWKIAQLKGFACEVKTLSKNRQLPKEEWALIEKGSIIYRCAPFLDEFGVLRVEGRTKNAEVIPYDTRYPIVLPKDHEITNRLLEYYHRRYGHANRETVFNEVRQRFFIPKLRSRITNVMKSCQFCKITKCRPLPPRMAPLPDYFGPVEVTVERRVEKRWIVLFTCLAVRAVHLEVSPCIMAIRRFVVRRGPPIAIFSDNGTNLKAANKELQKQIRQIDTACANVFTNARTRWSFNPPSAPHMGGIWERMVRTVKSTMSTLSKGYRMSDEILLTVIAEAEEIVNCRPLVYIPQDSSDSEAITPNHFLRKGVSELTMPHIGPTSHAEALRSTYKQSQYVADEMWKRWLREYVPSLNRTSKWLEESRPLKVGDLVFITDDLNRNGWVRGQVDQIITGKDGRVRQAMVRTAGGIYRRPVTKLALIEIMCTGKSPPEAGSGKIYGPGKC